MVKFSTILVAFFSLTSCTDSDRNKYSENVHFKEFEFCYQGGQTKGFCYLIDSSGVYVSPKNNDTLYFGNLPTGLLAKVDSIAEKIRPARRGLSDFLCSDCSIIAIKVISKLDTIRFVQEGEIDRSIKYLMLNFMYFNEQARHNLKSGNVHFETKDSVYAPPPSL